MTQDKITCSKCGGALGPFRAAGTPPNPWICFPCLEDPLATTAAAEQPLNPPTVLSLGTIRHDLNARSAGQTGQK